MEIKITPKDNRIVVTSPYNPAFATRAKELGGTWGAAQSAWVFDARTENNVRALLIEIYGSDGSPAELVDIRVTTTGEEWSKFGAPLMFCGRVVASAFGRDSGARLGEGISLIKGKAQSGGSVKNWKTVLSAGAVFEMFDVPRSIVEKRLESSPFEIEIIRSNAPEKTAEEAPLTLWETLDRALETEEGSLERQRVWTDFPAVQGTGIEDARNLLDVVASQARMESGLVNHETQNAQFEAHLQAAKAAMNAMRDLLQNAQNGSFESGTIEFSE